MLMTGYHLEGTENNDTVTDGASYGLSETMNEDVMWTMTLMGATMLCGCLFWD